MKKTTKNSGFTMAELVVALSISVIAFAMASVLLVGLFKSFDNGTTYNQQANDLKAVKFDVATFVQSSQDLGYNADLGNEWSSTLTFKKENEADKVFCLFDGKLLVDGAAVDSLLQVKSVSFAYNCIYFSV